MKAQIIDIPDGISYKYSNEKTNKAAELLMRKELTDPSSTALYDKFVSIGPNLWASWKSDSLVATIVGNLELHKPVLNARGEKTGVDVLKGRFIQDKADFQKAWRHLVNEIGKSPLTFRKLSKDELKYYWSVISFDIEEPIFVMQTQQRRYIVNISPKTLKLIWLDEYN
jgi:hypothetical protein